MTAHQHQLRRSFVGALALFMLSMLALSGYSLWRQREESIADGLQVAALHARSLESFLTQSLEVGEQVAANVQAADTTASSLERLQTSLVQTLHHSPFLRSLSLQDASGRIVASSNPANVGLQVRTDDFLPQVRPGQAIFRLGRPWSGRDFANGHSSSADQPVPANMLGFVPAVQPVASSRGALTLLLALNSDYFLNQMVRSVDSEHGRVDVLLYDATLLMTSAPDVPAGVEYPELLARMRLDSSDAGAFEQPAADTAGASLGAYRASRLYPFVVLTRLDRAHALQSWRADAQNLVMVLAPALLAVALLGWAMYRRQLEALNQRAEADRLLRINATVFEASSEGIVVTDALGIILSVNAAFCRMSGYSEAEVRGQHPRMLARFFQDGPFFRSMRQILLGAGVWQGELSERRKDGSTIQLQLTLSLSRDAEGAVQHYVAAMADISERKKNESRVLELNRDFVSFLDNSRDFIYFKDRHSRFRFASQTLATITGHAHWRDMTGKHDLEVFPPETARIYHEEEFPIFASGKPLLNKVDPYFDAQGRRGWVSTSKWPLLDAQGQVEGLFGISRDITEQKRSQEKLQLAASVFHNSREGITITDTAGTIVDVNEAFTEITGYSREEVIGQNPRILSSGRHNQEHYAAMWQSLIHKGHWYGEIWNRRKSGEVYAEMLTITTVRDEQGQAQNYVALFSDITTAKVHAQHLEHIAHYDALTSLPNRVLLADRLKQAMSQVQRRGQSLAVVYLDLDGFKSVNDSHGHEAGDQMLVGLATRMKGALREGDTLARIGGDEFVAVLVDLADATEAMPVLQRLLQAASEPVFWNAHGLRVSASVGVTMYPQHDEMDADQLQRQADQAMYQAKLAGKNRYHFFDAGHDRHVRQHHESLAHIRSALVAGEFVMHYQPKVHMPSGCVVGAEALIRWQHPQRGLLEPALFLPVLEGNALAVELDLWVIDAVLRQMQAWHEEGLAWQVSINVGARLLQQHDFVQRLQAILQAHPGVPAELVQLEVLETSALEDLGHVSHNMKACRELGVSFALDDFGTGYSSLTYVKRLPVSLIKIDKSFVHDMLAEPEDMAILRAITGLASAFRQEVLAEGVETLQHGIALMELGCELAQGYVIAKAMPAAQFVEWSTRWQCDAAWLRPAPASD